MAHHASTPLGDGTQAATCRPGSIHRERFGALQSLVGDAQTLYAFRTRDNLIKIGCTRRLAKRRSEVKGKQLLGFMPGDFDDEAEIHASLAPHVARGLEYYHPTPEVLAVVNVMREPFGLPPLTK